MPHRSAHLVVTGGRVVQGLEFAMPVAVVCEAGAGHVEPTAKGSFGRGLAVRGVGGRCGSAGVGAGVGVDEVAVACIRDVEIDGGATFLSSSSGAGSE